MSIDLNWETLTGGPDGAALAERIRDFIHVKFQSVPLPRFIKSVTVHDFAFGTIPPSVVLKDICDPLPDFYEENPDVPDEEDDDDDGDDSNDEHAAHGSEPDRTTEDVSDAIRDAERRRRANQVRRLEGGCGIGGKGRMGTYGPDGLYPPHIHVAGLRSAPGTPADMATPFLGLTPGVPGGTANMHYFQPKLATGWSGTQTPLAAVTGAQHLNSWPDMGSPQLSPIERYPSPSLSQSRSLQGQHSRQPSQGSISVVDFPPLSHSTLAAPAHPLREKHSVSTLAPTSAGASRPPTRDKSGVPHLLGSAAAAAASNKEQQHSNEQAVYDDDEKSGSAEEEEGSKPRKFREPKIDDLQAVFRIKYAGDVKLMLTAEILLDYPMPSFVGIPVKLNITGLTFDGVGVVAYIRKRVHFCFLSPEDALAAVGHDDDDDDDDIDNSGAAGERPGARLQQHRGRLGSLLQEVRVESEIGQREGTKQSLKNVGKVEKFVLEQVRRIFEEEFVYPSFWTFLV
ncbi:Mitochondrial distribution and morphology protein 12 [Parahypoxylon ruwenzoriense]